MRFTHVQSMMVLAFLFGASVGGVFLNLWVGFAAMLLGLSFVAYIFWREQRKK